MKHMFFVVTASLLCISSIAAGDLKKLNLDNTDTVSPKIQVDADVKVEGKGSIKITTQWPTTVCLAEVTDMDIENAKLIYKAKVKSDLDGAAFLEMWAHVSGGQYFSRGMNDVVTQKTNWRTIQTPFLFQKGQRPEKLTLNIVINGKGTLWVDDVVLSEEPLN